MNRNSLRNAKRIPAIAVALLFACVAALTGCSSDNYDSPPPDQVITVTASPLIDAATLKDWMDQGLVNAGPDTENVVILHVEPNNTADPPVTANYIAGHVPGAYIWNGSTELTQTRLDGLGTTGSELPTGSLIDSVLRRAGVNEKSTVVISYPPQSAMYYPARAYFTLRYWGFPKSQIKVLNGGSLSWTDAGYGLTTVVPVPDSDNSFSVRNNMVLRDDLRYSLGEMLQAVDANNAAIAATGSPTINIIQQTTSGRTIANAIGRSQNYFFNSFDAVTNTGGTFKTAAEVQAVLDDVDGPADDLTLGAFVPGISTITHCASGMSCTPIFFALDAILGMDVAVYDGSTNQWNAYRNRTNGTLVANNAWRTDMNGRSNDATVVYTGSEVIDPILNINYSTIDDPRANQVENEDREYMTPATSGPPTSVGAGDSSGC